MLINQNSGQPINHTVTDSIRASDTYNEVSIPMRVLCVGLGSQCLYDAHDYKKVREKNIQHYDICI